MAPTATATASARSIPVIASTAITRSATTAGAFAQLQVRISLCATLPPVIQRETILRSAAAPSDPSAERRVRRRVRGRTFDYLMRTTLACLALLGLCRIEVRADSTIDPTAALAWASNIGWTNWHASAADGAVIGEYVC